MKYRNISNHDLELPEVGIIKSGEVVEQPEGFNNVNFQKVEEVQEEKKQSKK